MCIRDSFTSLRRLRSVRTAVSWPVTLSLVTALTMTHINSTTAARLWRVFLDTWWTAFSPCWTLRRILFIKQTGSGSTAVSRMRNPSGHNYWNSSFITDVAMGQIPRSTERISSLELELATNPINQHLIRISFLITQLCLTPKTVGYLRPYVGANIVVLSCRLAAVWSRCNAVNAVTARWEIWHSTLSCARSPRNGRSAWQRTRSWNTAVRRTRVIRSARISHLDSHHRNPDIQVWLIDWFSKA